MSSPKDLPASVTANSLRALSEDKTQGITKQTTFQVDPELVEFEPEFNLRTKDDSWAAHVDRLYAAMKEGAAIPPIDVRVSAGKIICVDGEGRTTAAQRLREEFPDYRLQARQFAGNEQERVLHMLGTGSGQKALTPLEQGLGFLRLTRFGVEPSAIALKLGISRVTVDNNLVLAGASPEVQQMIKDGDVSSTTAREAIKQGPEGEAALKAAVTEHKANPTVGKTGKPSSKRTVTAAKLAGTDADKNKAKAAKEKAKAAKLAAKEKAKAAKEKAKAEKAAAKLAAKEKAVAPATPTVNADEINITVKKDAAQAAASFIRNNAPNDDAVLLEFAAALEIVLL